MKKMLAIVSAVVIVMQTTAQQTAEITVMDPSRPGMQEVFTVLTSNKKMKHGPYRKINARGNIITSGFYKENKKDSIWEEYNWNGQRLLSRGRYLDDEKAGVWEYFGYEAKELHKYDHTSKELIDYSFDPADSLHMVYAGNEVKMMRLDQPPILIGGTPGVQNTLLSNLRYPEDAIRTRKTGTVVIIFDVDTDGSVSNYQVKNKIHRSLDNEAMRVVKMIPMQWVPGIKDGKNVKVQMKQPVVFRLSQ